MSSCQVSAPHLPVQQNQTCPSYPHVHAGQVLKEDNRTFKRFFLGIRTKKKVADLQNVSLWKFHKSLLQLWTTSSLSWLVWGHMSYTAHNIHWTNDNYDLEERQSSPEHVHTVFLCNRIMHEKKNPSLCVIHTVQNLYKDSIIQIYLLHFSLFFLLWNTKSGSFEKETNIMVHIWLTYLLLHEIHL